MNHNRTDSLTRTILVEGSCTGSGVTLTTGALAVALRDQGERVLLVSDQQPSDKDLATPGLNYLETKEYNRLMRQRSAGCWWMQCEQDFILLDQVGACDSWVDDFILLLPVEITELTVGFGYLKENLPRYLEHPLYLLFNNSGAVPEGEASEAIRSFSGMIRRWLQVTPAELGCLPHRATTAGETDFQNAISQVAAFVGTSRLPLICWQQQSPRAGVGVIDFHR
ncbi:MAG: hypothetical protein ISR91_00655 [Candidatus Delongbacteria bacterium]|nr:hypothetical protein [Candidatus Delongbacteria bacterium]